MGKKRIIIFMIASLMALSISCVPVFAITAAPTNSTVYVDGRNISFDAYSIEGNNYFKLRDLAFVLNGTTKRFEIGFDAGVNAITLTSGENYTSVGVEMAISDGNSKESIPTNSKIIKDGEEVQFTAYNIDGSNYFKLRDIGKAFDFCVDWDSTQNAIKIDTTASYTETNDVTESIATVDKVPVGFTNGYELADFNKFNSYASDNGLGGTDIYLNGVITKTELIGDSSANTICGTFIDENSHEWLIMLHINLMVAEDAYDSMIGKQMVVCGSYTGYSGLYECPCFNLTKLCIKETGVIAYGTQSVLDVDKFKISYYDEFPTCPDFGAILNIPLFYEYSEEVDSKLYAYDISNVPIGGISLYIAILGKENFSYYETTSGTLSFKKDNMIIFIDDAANCISISVFN